MTYLVELTGFDKFELFFHETVTCDVEKAYFFLWLEVFEEFKLVSFSAK